MATDRRPDVVIIMTDEERAAPPYESDEITRWRADALGSWHWWNEHAVRFDRHYTGSLACVPSRPTMFTGQYPSVHGVTQTDGLGKTWDDSGMRWLQPGQVPTLGHWFRANGYDTHYDGKWHISHADLMGDDGQPLATNDDDGAVDHDAVRAYLEADRLDPFGFSGWVGPEPHGGLLANAGVRRDPLIAARVVDWLTDRYARRDAGDPDALRPFLLVASFVNPHDIVLFPVWQRLGSPLDGTAETAPIVPDIAPPPTAADALNDRPAVQSAYRDGYASAYGNADNVAASYTDHADAYRRLYYRLHAEVDGPLDRVRRAVTDRGQGTVYDTVLVRTSDHGELLGAHGGLHQKWYQLYDESTRVPFAIARIGAHATSGAVVSDMPTSHVDLVPTLLDVAEIDVTATQRDLAADHHTVHDLPGRTLARVLADPTDVDRERAVFVETSDHILRGDTGASVLARVLGLADDPPPELQIRVPTGMPTAVEGVIGRAADGALWKLVRTFDATTKAEGPGPVADGGAGLDDQWELYCLDRDPIEAHNRADDADVGGIHGELAATLAEFTSRLNRSNPTG